MPTNALYNLDHEKKCVLLDAAIEEFSINTYDKVSIFKIAKRANISRTGLYYYFIDKDDIYFYLLDSMKDAILEIINKQEKKVDIFDASYMFFDYMVSFKGTNREKFVLRVIENMSPVNHQKFFSDRNVKSKDSMELFEFGNIEYSNLKIETKEEICEIAFFIITVTLLSVQKYFFGENDLDTSKKMLKNKLEYLKYGIVK